MPSPLRDPKNGRALAPRPQPGYYPRHATLEQQKTWDEATRTLVLARVEKVPPLRFFTTEEQALAQAVIERVLPQDDRNADRQIPLLHYLDDRLHRGLSVGYRYSTMPEDGAAHRQGLQAIEAMARETFGRPFTELPISEQELLLQSLRDGVPKGGREYWAKLPVQHYWHLLVGDLVEAYYAHPYAWDEIGFGGPAYPRGYMRLEGGLAEPWEGEERRYQWLAPKECLSDSYKLNTSYFSQGHMGQGGTH